MAPFTIVPPTQPSPSRGEGLHGARPRVPSPLKGEGQDGGDIPIHVMPARHCAPAGMTAANAVEAD